MAENNRSSSSSSSSWILRTRFSRAVCYRPGSCKSVTWPCLPSAIAPPPPPPPLSSTSSSSSVSVSVPLSPPQKKKHDFCFDNNHDPHPPHPPPSSSVADFSFPSPFSPTSSDSSLKVASDSLYPSTDDDNTSSSSSAQISNSSGFLRSVFTSLSATSSNCRWSFSADNNTDANSSWTSPRGSLKASWFTKSSPTSSTKASPTASQKTSPRVSARSSPIVSPEASPRNSFRKTLEGAKGLMHRVPSWSSLLSNATGGERAVLALEEWMVDLKQLMVGERFACGSHSRIYRGMYKGEEVAVKVIRQPEEDGLLSERLLRMFKQEVKMLSDVQDHERVIKLIACCKKPPVLCVITEYLPGGSLRSFLNKRQGHTMPIQDVLKMALDIASAMEYLHLKNVIHRDLKSDNLVLAQDGSLKIVDFGVSCYESNCNARRDDDPGTYRWMAPEMLSLKPYSRKVDVYSFAIVLWELITTRLPYEDLTAVQAAFCVINKGMRPPIPEDCPASLQDLLESCWSTDPSVRPEFWQIMRSLNLFQRSLDSFDFFTLESPMHEKCLPSWLETE